MPKLIEINTTLNSGSTGRIAEGIALAAEKAGWDCTIVHGERYKRESHFKDIQVSNKLEERVHYLQSLMLDSHGLGSKEATIRLIKKLESLNPDIVHLHNIHGYYINYDVLFKFLSAKNIPVVWTLHDCWPFTGHCVYFDRINCDKWQIQCQSCPQKTGYPKSLLLDRSKRNYQKKKKAFGEYANLTIVPVSNWLGTLVRNSFLKNKKIHVIHNGINLDTFKPTESKVRKELNIEDKCLLIGVANEFDERKGFSDFIKLSKILSDDYQILLVGVSKQDIKLLPDNIIALECTENVQQLVDIYSTADIFLNPTYEDNFPTTNLEALACGTPVITYNTGGSPEAIDEDTGIVVEQGNVRAMADAIINMKMNPISSDVCRNRAEKLFEQESCFMEYVELYNELLSNNNVN